MNTIAIPPLTDEQRRIGRLAYIIKEDPPAYQAQIYRPLRALEAKLAAEPRTTNSDEPESVAELLSTWDRDLDVANRSLINSFRPSDTMPHDTLVQRVRAYVADYLASPF